MENDVTETFWGFDDDTDEQYQFDTYSRAREWVDESPEHRWGLKKVVTTRYEQYRQPQCKRCGKHVAQYALNTAGTCGSCYMIGRNV